MRCSIEILQLGLGHICDAEGRGGSPIETVAVIWPLRGIMNVSCPASIDNDNDDVYDLNGFQIRFFGKQQVKDLVEESGFELLHVKEVYEEPVTLYLVSTRKRK